MRKFFKTIIFLLIAVEFCQCQTGSNENYYSTDDDAAAVAEEAPVANINEIKVPIHFDPKTPMSENLKKSELKQLIIQKYYSFENPKNRRKHKPVLHRRTTSDGVIDLTVGGPWSYEEMWELGERHGHTLSEYFYDAAHIDSWTGVSASMSSEPKFKYVSPTSNLAKVYFIDDFVGFVKYNKAYCDNIINRIEDDAKDEQLKQAQEHQKLYE